MMTSAPSASALPTSSVLEPSVSPRRTSTPWLARLEHVDAAVGARPRAPDSASRRLVGRFCSGEDLGDAAVGFGADALGLAAPLAAALHVARAGELARLGEDVLQARLLRFGELEAPRRCARNSCMAGPLDCCAGVSAAHRVSALPAGRKRSRVRNLERAGAVLDHDAHVRGHARKQRQVRVLRRDHHRVAHDVLHVLRRLADLLDLAVEGAPGEGVDREGRPEPHAQAFDVGLVDRGPPHVAQVLRDREQHRRLGIAATVCLASTLRRITVPSTGARMMVRSRSTWACLSSESRCFTAASACTCACLTWICACTAFSLLACAVQHHGLLVELRRRDEFLVDQHLLACEVALGVGEADLDPAEFRVLRQSPERATATALSAASRSARVWLTRSSKVAASMRAMTLPFFTGRVEVRVDVLDLARDLRAHLDRSDRVQRAAATTTAAMDPRSTFAT